MTGDKKGAILGEGGNDFLSGGGYMSGGEGDDIYYQARGFTGAESATIVDNDLRVGNFDALNLFSNPYQLIFKKQQNDLVLNMQMNNEGDIRIKNWFLGDANHIERLQVDALSVFDSSLSYASTLSHTKVQGLVDAMVNFNPSSGQSGARTEITDPTIRLAIEQAWSMNADYITY